MAFVIPVTKEQYTSISKICVPLIAISLIFTISLFLIFTFIRIWYPNLADRVSFRLTFAALFCDIGYSGHLLYGLFWDNKPEFTDFSCTYATWATVFFTLASLFFIVCIVCNLHIVFVHESRIRYNYEKFYYIISLFVALLISFLPMTENMYGYDDVEVSCWYRNSGQVENIIWQWVTLFSWIVVSILYCAFVVMLVIKKLKSVTKKADLLDSSQVSDYPALINRNLISSVVRRVMWYPLVPLVVQFFNLFVETYAYVHSEVSYTLLLLCDIGLSLSGFLNALVFSQDIAVTRSFEDIKLNLWISNVNSFESHYPHRSHNKAIIDEFSMLRKSNDIVELNVLNRNKADIIIKDIIIDDVNNDISNNDIINNDITNNDINNDISNNNIIKNDITNNIVINNVINNNFINNNKNNNSTDYRIINSTNNSLILQPSLLEWLKYMLLIKLFSVPKNSSQLISPKILSQVDSYAGNKIITLTGKDDSKQDITYDSRNNDQNIHLIPPEPIHLKDSSPVDLFSNSLSLTDPVIESSRSNQTNQINQANQINISNPNNINNPNNTHVSLTNVIDESNCPVDDDGQINIILVNGETEDLSQNNEKIIQMLKML